MPVVFVHGVATRQTPQYQAFVAQRDIFFKRLVIGADDQIFDPDWGSNGVGFSQGGWVPKPGGNEALATGTALPLGGAVSVASKVAAHDLAQGVDLALAALLSERVRQGTPLGADEIAVFDAAVRYLNGGGDPTAFDETESDAQFVQTLKDELSPKLPATDVQAMSLGDVFTTIGDAVKRVTDSVRNVTSDAVLRVIREPLSNQVALFLGDIFVYLRYRETDAAGGTYNRIFQPIASNRR